MCGRRYKIGGMCSRAGTQGKVNSTYESRAQPTRTSNWTIQPDAVRTGPKIRLSSHIKKTNESAPLRASTAYQTPIPDQASYSAVSHATAGRSSNTASQLCPCRALEHYFRNRLLCATRIWGQCRSRRGAGDHCTLVCILVRDAGYGR
jgi:hypothetical protein